MQKRMLGALEVSAIGLGCMSMSQAYGNLKRAGEIVSTKTVAGDRYARAQMISLDPEED